MAIQRENMSMATKAQMLKAMLDLQNTLNSKITDDWRAMNRPWYRAIWTENAETMGHVGWKWWKNETMDVRQVQIELVDIFHFALSSLLQEYGSTEDVLKHNEFVDILMNVDPLSNADVNKEDILEEVEAFVVEVLVEKVFTIKAAKSLAKLMAMTGLGTLDLFLNYIGKNALNIFRQDNGYNVKGSGEYIKIWHGEEDNVWLAKVLDEIVFAKPEGEGVFDPEAVFPAVFGRMNEIYIGVKANAGK